MKSSILLTTFATLLFAGCAGSGQLSKKVQSLDIEHGTTKPTRVVGPSRSTEFLGFASAQSSLVESAVYGGVSDAVSQFGRFQLKTHGADAVVVFDSVRHGVTYEGGGLYAPIVEARIRVVDAKGRTLLRRSDSATSGEVHELDTFVRTSGLYRDAVGVSARRLGVELASSL